MREAKLEEFVNCKQGNMSVNEHALRSTLLSKYVPSLVESLSDLNNRFIKGCLNQSKKNVIWQYLLMT